MQHEPKFTVCLYRGTNDVDNMVAFLQTLGMGPVFYREDDDDLIYVPGLGGLIALYENPDRGRPARAELAFQTNDHEAAARLFQSYDVKVDTPEQSEQDGVTVLDVNGQSIWVTEIQGEFAKPAVEPTVEVLALRYTPRPFSDGEFFEVLGFTNQWDGAADWRLLAADEPAGRIGLAPGNVRGCDPGQASVQLGFDTSEPLDQLAARLKAAGYCTGDIVSDTETPFLTVTDPDGITTAVFRRLG